MPHGALLLLCERKLWLMADSSENWSPMYIERIETVPVTKENLLALMNRGMSTFVRRCDIIDRIS